MRRRRWIVSLVLPLAVLCTVLLLGCSLKASAPQGFPADFPLPEGRMMGEPEHPDANSVQFTIEAYDGTTKVVQKYNQQLASSKWKRVIPGEKPFDSSEDYDTASLTDGIYQVDVIVTDLGNTTKVGFTAKKL